MGHYWYEDINVEDVHIYSFLNNMIRVKNRIFRLRFICKALKHWLFHDKIYRISHIRARRLTAYDLKEYVRLEIVLIRTSRPHNNDQHPYFIVPCSVHDRGSTYIFHLITIQRFFKRVLALKREKQIALCMAQHHRLGMDSPLFQLDPMLLRNIVNEAFA
jgi:hypothetical protein